MTPISVSLTSSCVIVIDVFRFIAAVRVAMHPNDTLQAAHIVARFCHEDDEIDGASYQRALAADPRLLNQFLKARERLFGAVRVERPVRCR